MRPLFPILLIVCVMAPSAFSEALVSDGKKAGASLEDPALNPWIYPLDYCAKTPGKYDVDMDMGFLNTDYFCSIDKTNGVKFITNTVQPVKRDAARRVLEKINACKELHSVRILVGGSRNTEDELRQMLPLGPAKAVVNIGLNKNAWSPPETHAKVFQLGNGVDRFFTVHGSLNLQTVGLSCKANNALRFVEKSPTLHRYFTQMSDALQSNNGEGKFEGGSGTTNSSGTDLLPATIGDYAVQFYAGKAEEFVGGVFDSEPKEWPSYINPPITNQHLPGVINWYDSVIYDAAYQLRQGRTVNIDVLIFEVGEESAFVNNLWKFVQEGFSTLKSEDKSSAETVDSRFMGNLQVRFLWQFQSTLKNQGNTFANLNAVPKIQAVFGHGTRHGYVLETGRTWPHFNRAGLAINPNTPYDMHNKFMLLNVVGHEAERKLYVTSSNMDMPKRGSGNLWQAGTIVSARPGSSIWSGGNANSPSLWNAYHRYFEMLWANRDGQPHSGQNNFLKQMDLARSQGPVNWIETTGNRNGANFQEPREGIDAFFFPINFRQ